MVEVSRARYQLLRSVLGPLVFTGDDHPAHAFAAIAVIEHPVAFVRVQDGLRARLTRVRAANSRHGLMIPFGYDSRYLQWIGAPTMKIAIRETTPSGTAQTATRM